MKKFIAILILIVLSALACAQRVTSYGPTPPGFSWYEAPNAEAVVLKPDGWFIKTESKNGTGALFISREDISTSGEFQTGLSLNLVHGVQSKSGLPSSKYAIGFLSKILEGNEELMSFANPDNNGMMSLGLRLRNKKLDKVIHFYLIANDIRDTLHIFMFESPAQEWDSAWKIGEPMFRNLRLIFPR